MVEEQTWSVPAGTVYSASVPSERLPLGIVVPNAALNLWEITAAPSSGSVIIRQMSIEFAPTISFGVAQDVRASLTIADLLTLGSGGTPVTPVVQDATRGTVGQIYSATTTCNAVVTSPGALGAVLSAENPTLVRRWSPRMLLRAPIVIAGGNSIAVVLGFPLGAAYYMTSTIVFEEGA